MRGSYPPVWKKKHTRDIQISQLHRAQVRAKPSCLLRQMIGEQLAVHALKGAVQAGFEVQVGLPLGVFLAELLLLLLAFLLLAQGHVGGGIGFLELALFGGLLGGHVDGWFALLVMGCENGSGTLGDDGLGRSRYLSVLVDFKKAEGVSGRFVIG